MTLHYRIITTLLGLTIACIILGLIRRDKLYVRYSFWWVLGALAVIVIGVFPNLIDRAGEMLGVSYPPVLVLTVGICLLLVKVLTMDIERSRHEREIRTLTQRLAVLEGARKDSGEAAGSKPGNDAGGRP